MKKALLPCFILIVMICLSSGLKAEISGSGIREPAVSGQFYPADSSAASDSCLAEYRVPISLSGSRSQLFPFSLSEFCWDPVPMGSKIVHRQKCGQNALAYAIESAGDPLESFFFQYFKLYVDYFRYMYYALYGCPVFNCPDPVKTEKNPARSPGRLHGDDIGNNADPSLSGKERGAVSKYRDFADGIYGRTDCGVTCNDENGAENCRKSN